MSKSKWPRIKWNQSCAELANRPFADLFEDQGDKTMTIAEDILSDIQLIDLTHRDAQFVRAELIDKIDTAIAAVVAAEREACAIAAGQAVMRIKTGTQQAHDMTLAEFRIVCSCAAEDAIRARSNDPH